MISPISYNKPNFNAVKPMPVKQEQAEDYYIQRPKKKLSYMHSLGVSALFGTTVAGLVGIVAHIKPTVIAGLTTMGLSMLLNIPDKIYGRK